IRPLDWSERTLLAMLDTRAAARLTIVEPDYADDTARALFDRWGYPSVALSSRYHATVALAWRGTRLATITRNDKLRGLAEDLDLPAIACFTHAREGFMALS